MNDILKAVKEIGVLEVGCFCAHSVLTSLGQVTVACGKKHHTRLLRVWDVALCRGTHPLTCSCGWTSNSSVLSPYLPDSMAGWHPHPLIKWQLLPCLLPLHLSSSASLHSRWMKVQIFKSWWSSKFLLKTKPNAIFRVALYLSVAAHLIWYSRGF